MAMYFSALKRMIASVEEKLFYDVALLFLGTQGYEGVSIVDGSGDGGRDVLSPRSDLRIQLSVRRDWEQKINSEAALTQEAGKRHFVYITNRLISPDAEADFRTNRFKYSGAVEVSIYDLNYIATALSTSGVIGAAYATLGIPIEYSIPITPREVAISSVMLFGREAKELRESIIDVNICATLFDQNEPTSESDLVSQVSMSLPGVNTERSVRTAVSRLRASGDLQGPASSVSLSSSRRNSLGTARLEFSQALDQDIGSVSQLTRLSRTDSLTLLAKARELLVRGRELHGSGLLEEDFRAFLSEKGLTGSRKKIYDVLSQAQTIQQFQFGAVVDRIFSTDTFDIYRSLGGRTDIELVLDTSVVLPLLLGLEFEAKESRYGLAVSDLDRVCRNHDIKLTVPTVYVNEMAAHGRKALDYLEIYPALPDEGRIALRNSRNAYLSHFSHLSGSSSVKLEDFLAHFGVVRGYSLRRIENRIQSMLELHGIGSGFGEWYDQSVRSEIQDRKPNEVRVIVDHDAAVCTTLIKDNKKGYILATWDNILREVVQDLARVFADNPARINDTLSVIEGVDFESTKSHELLFTLLHMDEAASHKLAEKIDEIASVEEAYQFRKFVEQARQRQDEGESVSEEQMLEYFGE